MAINETIVTGRKFRKLANAATKQWQRLSFWHKASDCEFNDGKNAETKLGAVDGITDSLASTSSRIAASAKAVNSLNNNLNSKLPNNVKFLTEGSGANTKYYVQLGADAASKKLLGSITPKYIGGAIKWANWNDNTSMSVNVLEGTYTLVCVQCTSTREYKPDGAIAYNLPPIMSGYSNLKTIQEPVRKGNSYYSIYELVFNSNAVFRFDANPNINNYQIYHYDCFVMF